MIDVGGGPELGALWQSFLDTRVRIFAPGVTTEVVIGDGATVATTTAERTGGVGGPVHLVTAWNPRGVRTDLDTNRRRNRELRDDIERAGLTWHPAAGVAEDGSWAEAGFALLDVDLPTVLDLGRRYDQEAIYRWDPQQRYIAVVACFEERTALRQASAERIGARPCALAPPGERRAAPCATADADPAAETALHRGMLAALGCDVCGRCP